MKHKLTLLLLALVTCIGTWADETFTIIDNANGGVWPNGSYSSDNGSSTWKGSWTSTSTTPRITVSAHTWLLQNSTGYIGSSSSKTGNYTIKISDGYLITGYEIVFENVNTDGSHNQTITPKAPVAGSAVTATGTGSATATVTGLNTRNAYFTLSGENTLARVTKFTVTYTTDAYTWSSGVPSNEVGGSGNYYSRTWYLKLTSPNVDDVFFDAFTLGFASDGSVDDDIATYLAFTSEKFSGQYNHEAGEFIAISSNALEGHSSAAATIQTFNFDEKVRLSGNTAVYACFVSKNADGTYNLQKRGLAVKKTSSNGTLYYSANNTYTTAESNTSAYQCHYSCTYSRCYEYPQSTPDNYRIWTGINYADRTSGGKIHIAYMKYTAPGTAGQYVHFDRFSLSLRGESGMVLANTYLLFSKECLTGAGVTETTEFEPGRFTAISTNKVPTENPGIVFTFAFDSDAYLDGGATYYIYMGTKQSNGNFCLTKYGIYINDAMNNRFVTSGFAYSSALETAVATTNNNWQPIYYSSKCTFSNSKVVLNIQEAGSTIRTKTLYTNSDVDLKTALNIPSCYTVTPASITYSAGASSQDVTINAGFTPSAAPATEVNHRYFFKLTGKYAGGANGKTLSATTDLSENDQWTIGGNYFDGYTFYNVGQAKYLSVDNKDNSQGTFVAEGSAKKFIAVTNDTGFSFKLLGTRYCYLNNNAGSDILSTWTNTNAPTNSGSLVIIENPLVSLFSDFFTNYNDISIYSGLSSDNYGKVGYYHNDSYTQEQLQTALNDASTAYSTSNARDFITSYSTLSTIKSGLTINQPATNRFYRFNIGENYMCNVAGNDNVRTVTTTSNDASTVFYLDNNSYLIAFADGYGFNFGYCKPTATGIFNVFDFSESSTKQKYLIHSNAGTGNATWSDRYITVTGSKLNEGQGEWTIAEVTSLPITMNEVDGKYYGTINLPVAVTIPEGVYAYKAAVAGDVMTLTKVVENGVLAANTPVVLYSASEVTSLAISAEAGTGADDDAFSGTTAAITAPAGTNYVLSNSTTEGVGFYKYTGSVIPGFKAYFNDPSGSPVKGFSFSMEDVETAIRAIESENNDLEIYDIAGRRVPQAQKGLYIVNGKKVMFK